MIQKMKEIISNILLKVKFLTNNIMSIMTQYNIPKIVFQWIFLGFLCFKGYEWYIYYYENIQTEQLINRFKLGVEFLDKKLSQALAEFKINKNNIQQSMPNQSNPNININVAPTLGSNTNTIIWIGLSIVSLFASYYFGPWLKGLAASFGSKGIGEALTAIKKNQMNQVLYGKSKFESIKNEFVNLRTEMEFYHTKQMTEAAKHHFEEMIAILDDRINLTEIIIKNFDFMYQSLSVNNTLTEIITLALLAGGMEALENMNDLQWVSTKARLDVLIERSNDINRQLLPDADE